MRRSCTISSICSGLEIGRTTERLRVTVLKLAVLSFKVTVRPDDARLGDSLVCQLRRPDGYSSEPAPGTQCLIGWDGYDPSERYAVMASASGQPATSVSIQAATVNLGDEQGQMLVQSPLAVALLAFATTASTATTAAQIAAAAATLQTALTPLPVTTKTKAS